MIIHCGNFITDQALWNISAGICRATTAITRDQHQAIATNELLAATITEESDTHTHTNTRTVCTTIFELSLHQSNGVGSFFTVFVPFFLWFCFICVAFYSLLLCATSRQKEVWSLNVFFFGIVLHNSCRPLASSHSQR